MRLFSDATRVLLPAMKAIRWAIREIANEALATLASDFSELYSKTGRPWVAPERLLLNRPGFAGGSNFQIGWSHDEQNDEQIFSRGSRPRGANGFGSRKRARHAVGARGVDRRQDRLLTAHVA